MPVVRFHIVEGMSTVEQRESLLLGATKLYADILDSPVERIRAFIHEYKPDSVAAGGQMVTTPELHAPFFEFIVLAGRPREHRIALMEAFTALLVDTLAADRSRVRGQCIRVEPDDWCIAGNPASETRKAEIQARAAQ